VAEINKPYRITGVQIFLNCIPVFVVKRGLAEIVFTVSYENDLYSMFFPRSLSIK